MRTCRLGYALVWTSLRAQLNMPSVGCSCCVGLLYTVISFRNTLELLDGALKSGFHSLTLEVLVWFIHGDLSLIHALRNHSSILMAS